MRVLFLSTYFRPDIASTGVLMTRIAEGLVHLGHHVTVVTSMPHYDRNQIWPEYRGRFFSRETYNGLNVCRVYLHVPKQKDKLVGRLLNYASFNSLSALAGTLAGRHDVIFVPSPPLTNGLSADLISRLRRTPFVYNVQDIYPDIAIRTGVMTNPKVITLFRRMEKYVYRRAAAVAVISEGFRRNLLTKGVPQAKIEVIPNFMDTEFVRPLPKNNSFSKMHKLEEKFVILFAGNVGLSQGLETVIDTAKLLERQKELSFLIVGNGAAKAGLESYVDELGLENVHFLPFQPHESLPEMYASADVCLVPLREGFTAESVPCKVFTITAAGRPLIASVDAGSDTHRFVETAHCGLWIEPENPEALAETIRALFNDAGQRELLGQNGRRHAEKYFSAQGVVQQYAALLERVAR